MAINLPNNPTDGQTFQGYRFDADKDRWDRIVGGGGNIFSPTKANLFPSVRQIFHPATNAGVSADDANNELDVTGGGGGGVTEARVRELANNAVNTGIQNGVQIPARAAPGNEINGVRQYFGSSFYAPNPTKGHLLKAQGNGSVAWQANLSTDNFGIMNVTRVQVVTGYEFTGYATTLPAGGMSSGTQTEPIGGLYTATLRTTTDPAFSNIRQGATYFSQVASGNPSVPRFVIIDDRTYEVKHFTGRFYEVLGFAGFTAGNSYRVQILFTNGRQWIITPTNVAPFSTIKVLPEGTASDTIPAEFDIKFSDRQTDMEITAVALSISGQPGTLKATTPISNIATRDNGVMSFTYNQTQRNTISGNIEADAESISVDITITFKDTTTYQHREAYLVHNNNFAVPSPTKAQIDALKVNADTVDGFNIVSVTAAQYAAITTKDSKTIYLVDA